MSPQKFSIIAYFLLLGLLVLVLLACYGLESVWAGLECNPGG
jgi:hypothetical protein